MTKEERLALALSRAELMELQGRYGEARTAYRHIIKSLKPGLFPKLKTRQKK